MGKNSDKSKSGWKRVLNKKIILSAAALAVIIGAGLAAYMVKASENPAFCSTCHVMQPYYDSYHEGILLASKHAEADMVCHDCHESSLAIQAEEGWKFLTGNYQIPLEKREFSRDFCLECHDDFDTDVKTATNFEESNPHDSHNGEMECNECHSMHQPSQVMCAECHTFSWMNELDEGWVQTE